MRLWIVVIGVLAAIGLWWGIRVGITEGDRAIQSKAGVSSINEFGDPENSGAVRTKPKDREPGSTRYTHSPVRLQEFMLPAITIDGMTLDAALRKLMSAYKEACVKCSETPLPLTFAIPPGTNRELTVHLPAGNFKASVQLLATLSGMKASRKDLAYQFKPLAGDGKLVNRSIQTSPDFLETLNEMVGASSDSPPDPYVPIFPQHILKQLGLLDPSAHVSLSVAGELKLENMSAASATAITELVGIIGEQTPVQVMTQTKIVEITADANWTPPDETQMTDDQIATTLRNLAQQKGVELQTLPSVTARNGQNATVENVNEFVYPIDAAGKKFASRNTGKTLHIHGNLLGFGHEMDLKFTDTTAEIDPKTDRPVFENRTDMAEKSYSGDGGTKLVVQTRPDGSHTLMLLKPTMIDATGQPVR